MRFVSKAIFISFFLISSCLTHAQPPSPIQIFAESGQIQKALNEYRNLVKKGGEQDYTLLRCIAKNAITSGWDNSKLDIKLYALFGALLAEDDEVNALLKNPFCQHPILQLTFLNILKQQRSPLIESYSNELLRSPLLEIRFHTLDYLASIGHPKAFPQIQALSAKLPADWQVLFASLAAKIPDKSSSQYLEQLLSSSGRLVKIYTIAALTEQKRKDFFPSILLNKRSRDPLMQEALIQAINIFGDSTYADIVHSYTDSVSTDVQAAAFQTLKKFQDPRGEQGLNALARKEELAAIAFCDDTTESKELLLSLSQSKNRHVQMNAHIQLAFLGSKEAIFFLSEELFEKGGLIEKRSSPCNTVYYYLYRGQGQNEYFLKDTNELKMRLLGYVYQTDEQNYYELAKKILQRFQDPLALRVIEDLGRLSTTTSLAILEEFSEKPGDPFIRTYCHAELYRRTKKEEHFEKVKSFIFNAGKRNTLLFQNPLEKPKKKQQLPLLSLDKESKLYLDLLSLLSFSQDERVIDLLIRSMEEGPQENSYILAGLLLKATL